jgi:hypothetical protein
MTATLTQPDTIPTTVTPSMILEQAAAILERDGWATGNLCETGGQKCALGAIGSAMGLSNDLLNYSQVQAYGELKDHPAVDLFAEHIANTHPEIITKYGISRENIDKLALIYYWNDSRTGDASEVTDELRVAAMLG